MAKKQSSKVQTKSTDKSNSKAKTKENAKELEKKSKTAAKTGGKVIKVDPKKISISASVEIEVEETIISDAKPSTKQSVKTKAKSKVKKTDKKQDDGFDDDLGDDFGDSEIAEYEDDLKAVEDQDDENLDEFSDDDDSDSQETEVYLTDSEGRRLCRVRDCDQVSQVDGYCRYHYLLLWKKIQVRKSILKDGKLEKYVIDLTSRYPDKFLEMIKKDLKTEKDFLGAIAELEIDESALVDDSTDDDAQSFADEIRGTVDAPTMDDDGDY